MIPSRLPDPFVRAPAATELDSDARFGTDPAVLHALAEPCAAGAIWQHYPDPAVEGGL